MIDGADALARRIAALDAPTLLAFDVDGTLAPIVTDPAAAAVPEHVQTMLGTLHASTQFEVALLTGRDAASLRRMVPGDKWYRAVDHGATVLRPGSWNVPPPSEEQLRTLSAFAAKFEALGARIEKKQRSVGVHVRGIEGGPALLEQALMEGEKAGLHVREGRGVVEASPVHGDKGSALSAIAKAVQASSIFFIGDDLTDLPAIEVANASGIGAFVVSEERPKAPAGVSEVAGPDQVIRLLEQLLGR